MQKNRLFIKIYLWFWLTTIVLLLTMFTINVMSQARREKDDMQRFILPLVVLQGQQSVNVYENESAASFNRFIEHREIMPDVRMYIFEDGGKEITGHKVPAKISALVAKAGKDKITDTVISGDKNLVLKSITSYKMNKYLIAAEVPHRPLLLPLMFGPPNLRHSPEAKGDHVPPPEMGPGARRQEPLPLPGPDGGMKDLFLLVAAILVVSGAICYLLARYLSAPLVKLSSATRRFAAGDFSVRVNPAMNQRKDETSDLALDFDHMAERIESLLMSQRNLLRDISHELRSPLARINVALELCRKRSGGEAIKYLERIEQETGKLNELIEQILTLNRVESGITKFNNEKMDLSRLINQIADDANFEARSMNRTVKVVHNEQCIMTGNSELIKRAVENVVRNAVLYTVEGSTVEISLKTIRENDHFCAAVTVRDYGPGVPEDEIANIFQPFYRIDDDRDRKTGGAGIGLTIADAAVHLHSGSIKVVNVPEGGLRMEILLPMGKIA